MKRIELKRLKIENFKGCKSRVVDFSSKTDIFGANAAGKTTIMDAFMWLLFDKDSTGASKFDIRPLDADGNMINNIEIMVEALLDIDGTEVTLQKLQKQNWVKKRGTDTISLQGNVNTYEINSFPASEKEYKVKICEIISEDLFKLLTDPRAFAVLPWRDQREILLKFISGITDEDVLETDKSGYAPVAEEILAAGAEKSAEKAKKSMSKLRDRQKELPARIDEASKSMVQVPDLADLELQRNVLNEQLEDVQKQRNDAGEAYRAVSDLQGEIMQVKLDMSGLQQAANGNLEKRRRDARRLHDDLEAKAYELFNVRKRKELEVDRLKALVDEKEVKRSALGKEYTEAMAMTLNEAETICKMCGQTLPADKIEEIRSGFEKRKSELVNRVLSDGRKVKSEINDAKTKISVLETEISDLKQQWNEVTSEENGAYEAMNEVPATADMSENQEYMALQDKLSRLEIQIGNMDTGEGIKQQLEIREREIRAELDAVNNQFAAAESNDRVQNRIAELKEEQKEVGQKVADQEQKIFLLEKFSRTKMDMLATEINSKFEIVSFKLFEMQFNGGIKGTCEMTVDGVPYSSLNSAAKMQAGLDVISALSKLYDVSVPVWIDNRESVSEIPDIGGQVINLFVSPSDKELRVEAE